MLSRKGQEIQGKKLPKEWVDEVTQLLHSVYRPDCDRLQKKFEIYGFIYPNELWLAVSLLDRSDNSVIPVTCILSSDIDTGCKIIPRLRQLLDSAGFFFDHFFADKEWDDYVPDWQLKEDITGDFYYLVTRENIALSLQADELLRSKIEN
ncbi:MAG: hypothetical protein WCG27_05075 [Pseudomonadota bacterium]